MKAGVMMSPNSLTYLLFLTVAAVVHQLLRPRHRSLFLVVVSWAFYGICTPNYFPLLIATICVNFGLAISMERWTEMRRPILILGLLIDFGALFLFKYLNFFGEIITGLLEPLGIIPLELPEFVQPLGISFYTFVITGYLIDVYRGDRRAERSFVDFSLFVSFFPAVLSGPIARTKELLPQIKAHQDCRVTWSMVKLGITRFLIGLVKKLLLADQLSILVGTVYGSPEQFSGLQVWLAAVAYSLQIYCDFSSYSDMAIGAGLLFGLRLKENFDAPYLAESIQDFWRRWHISLSTWFRDYLYFPLGGSRRGKLRTYCNVLIVFAVSGLWHGAAMKYVIWGLLNGLYQVVGSALSPVGKRLRAPLHMDKKAWPLRLAKLLVTFSLSTLAWVFFRADSTGHAIQILRCLLLPGKLLPLTALGMNIKQLRVLGISLLALILWDVLGKRYRLAECLTKTVWLRDLVWLSLILAILCFGAYGTGYDVQEFVYFKF
jgi:D-alanyl-lipoteichoic acid acyltransferase DltB (MBOAT superfamily)